MRSLYHFLYHLECSWVKQETFIIYVILVLFDEKFILSKHHFFPYCCKQVSFEVKCFPGMSLEINKIGVYELSLMS